MPQPTAVNLFGTGATISGGNLTVPLSAYANLEGSAPIEVFGALIDNAANWLAANTDETVNATADKSYFAPITRNNVDKTQFNINFQLYGAALEVELDPDDL